MLRSIAFTVQVGEVTNNYSISIPNNRQLIEIETMKSVLSVNQYTNMISTHTFGTQLALDLIDMISWFTVMCKPLIKDLNCNSLLDLDVMDSKLLLDVYRNTIAPWIVEWQGAFSNPPIPENAAQ